MSGEDDYPPEARPDWLKPFAHVKGVLSSAPLDLPARLDLVTKALQADGWTVVVRSVGTDFSSWFGVPRPKDQPLDLLINRSDAYTATDAEGALAEALRQANITYSPIGAWGHELETQVVAPTIADTKKAVSSSLPWVLVGIGAVLMLVVLRETR